MAIPILSIIKTLAPLVGNAGSIVAGLRTGSSARLEDRVGKLEEQTIRAGEVLSGVARQLQALAEQTAAIEKRARTALVLSTLALGVSVGAIVTLLVKG